MRAFKAVLAWFSMVLAGMYGGQKNKSVRRFGIPAIAVTYGWSWKSLWFLLLIPVLIMGYGENSVLMKLIGVEWAVRAVYACLLSIPFAFFGLLRWVISAVLLVIAFQVRAGSFGNIPWFGDLLIEDIVRYGTLSALVIFTLARPSTRRNP